MVVRNMRLGEEVHIPFNWTDLINSFDYFVEINNNLEIFYIYLFIYLFSIEVNPFLFVKIILEYINQKIIW